MLSKLGKFRQEIFQEVIIVHLMKSRVIILIIIGVIAFILGRLAVRAVLNLLMGGTLFGGNFL